MHGPFYARYIPPKPTASAPAPKQTIPTTDQVEEDPEKEKKSKKPKRKREKDAASINEGVVDEDDTPSKRHKTVLAKYQKSSQRAKALEGFKSSTSKEKDEEEKEPLELHDLTPLPQPEQVPEPDYKPSFSTLPLWLAQPLVVESDLKVPFDSLGLGEKLLNDLSSKNYKEALAVQSAVLPLLLPGPKQHKGDLCISATTGSGKTLAYVLPLIESLKSKYPNKMIRGLIVVPTRELVAQAKEVAESFTAGTGLKIGTAFGTQPLNIEQAHLIKKGNRYDPSFCDRNQEEAKVRISKLKVERDSSIKGSINKLSGYVPTYESKVDILICTPGRLVEHIQSTTGFSLKDLSWFVIDEADNLLNQSFQEWVGIVMTEINSVPSLSDMFDSSTTQPIRPKQSQIVGNARIKKVVLSATMTRDLNKLNKLNLHRPRLVVVQAADKPETGNPAGEMNNGSATAKALNLPSTLKEWAIPVGDGSDKPLYLLKLLQTRILPRSENRKSQKSTEKEVSHSDSESSSDSSSSSSEPSDSSDSEDSSAEENSSDESTLQQSVLIFTNSNENASRLCHLLSTLHAPYSKITGALTKSSAYRRKLLRSFKNGEILIVIASDRASRGLDVPNLAHIVNYDIPKSLTDYVHRVGRTARAGRDGHAWSFFTDVEARWFWNAIARAPEVKNSDRKVQRLKFDINSLSDKSKDAYVEALDKLRLAVQGNEAS
ncbi:P-loop containing nucleoside triphosphate hydrolase protein [Patellaria atrata CBS 101060]|uniref:ATP-dependent RNA helicase n=1 Tax=Patellaria atrata CBS 101060 TaxID=1346257 RepID=A0A9P4SK11_9PEZI|nr:P-loop containing nucleoside triphosphate hydrolase protein [Patellaria atrata CBS 101060]